jgi:hypothetical protein
MGRSSQRGVLHRIVDEVGRDADRAGELGAVAVDPRRAWRYVPRDLPG